MSHLIALLALAVWAPAALAGEGHETGNGGYFCNGVPCDLFYEKRDYKLPYADEQQVSFESLPAEVARELETMNKIIKRRSIDNVDLLAKWKERVQIYNTKTFLGDDTHYSAPGVSSRQVGYAYLFTQVNAADKSELVRNYVIELDLDYLRQHPARHQAMAIMHEIMHFVPNLDHAVIAPTMKSLDEIMKLHDRQVRGERRPLRDSELQTLRDFQAYLVHLGMEKHLVEAFDIHKNGGGLVAKALEGKVSPTNFVSVVSRVHKQIGEEGSTYYWEHNEVLDDVVSPSIPAEYKKYRFWESPRASLKMRRYDGDAGTRTELALQGGVTPIRRCNSFNENGTCTGFLSWIPVEAAVRTEDGSVRIERFAVSIMTQSFNVAHNSGEMGCTISLGRLSYERLRWKYGSLYNLDGFGADCEFIFDLMSKKRLQIVTGIDINFPVSFAILDPGANENAGELAGLALSSNGTGKIGVRLLNRAEVFAIGSGQLISTSDLGLSETYNGLLRLDYGFTGKLKLSKNLYIGAELLWQRYMTEIGEYSDDIQGDEIRATHKERYFGITIGGRHDLLGPYTKKKR